jgi:hypothetical protein
VSKSKKAYASEGRRVSPFFISCGRDYARRNFPVTKGVYAVKIPKGGNA